MWLPAEYRSVKPGAMAFPIIQYTGFTYVTVRQKWTSVFTVKDFMYVPAPPRVRKSLLSEHIRVGARREAPVNVRPRDPNEEMVEETGNDFAPVFNSEGMSVVYNPSAVSRHDASYPSASTISRMAGGGVGEGSRVTAQSGGGSAFVVGPGGSGSNVSRAPSQGPAGSVASASTHRSQVQAAASYAGYAQGLSTGGQSGLSAFDKEVGYASSRANP
jgi:hypothetical protein